MPDTLESHDIRNNVCKRQLLMRYAALFDTTLPFFEMWTQIVPINEARQCKYDE